MGPFTIPWQRLCQCDPSDPLVSSIEYIRQRTTTAKITDLLVASDGRRSRDPRDRIYSLLGIYQRDHKDHFIQPDYTKPVAEVFAQAAHQVILELGRLFFVEQGYQPRISMTSHPKFDLVFGNEDLSGTSWVPDWTGSCAGEIDFSRRKVFPDFRNWHPRFTMHVQLKGCRLQVAGALLGYRAGANDFMMDDHRLVGLPDCHSAVRLGDLLSGTITNFGARIAQSKNSLRQLELFADADETMHAIHQHTVRRCVCRHNASLTTPSMGSTTFRATEQAWKSLSQGTLSIHGRTVGRTSEAPDDTPPWPLLLCILFGSDIPVILRPVKHSQSNPVRFRLVSRVSRLRPWVDSLLRFGWGYTYSDQGVPGKEELGRFSWLPMHFELE